MKIELFKSVIGELGRRGGGSPIFSLKATAGNYYICDRTFALSVPVAVFWNCKFIESP